MTKPVVWADISCMDMRMESRVPKRPVPRVRRRAEENRDAKESRVFLIERSVAITLPLSAGNEVASTVHGRRQHPPGW
jgi:hypothetical protein